jgi:hypothetical protein
MADRLPAFGDFEIPSAVIDLHEWMVDAFLDGELGSLCTLVYPNKREECPNCVFDRHTRRSSNIYKTDGPIEFPSHSLCPLCNGVGYSEQPSTDTIRLRVYWEPREWRSIGVTIADPQGLCMIIGYMDDLPKLERANFILVNDAVQNVRNYKCARAGEAQPWGFRKDRYFRQMLKRTGGGS